jgi:ribonuclease VapC
MFLDASVIVAILKREPGWEIFQSRIVKAGGPIFFSAMVRYEAMQAIARSHAGKRKPNAAQMAEASAVVDEYLGEIEARHIDIDAATGSLAIEASMRYGKAVSHPAGLNMGDCFAYACAKALNVPLLYKGDDFARTDLA